MNLQGVESTANKLNFIDTGFSRNKANSASDEFSALSKQMVANNSSSENNLPVGLEKKDYERAVDYGKLATQAYDPRTISFVEQALKFFGGIDDVKEQTFDTPNYKKIDQHGGRDWPHTSGLDYTVFENKETGDLVVAFSGTEPLSPIDWIQDIKQAFGHSEQYDEAIDFSRQLQSDLDTYNEANGTNKKLTFTGHSLGGGLATAAALATGNEAFAFEAAGLSQGTIDKHNLDVNHADKVKNFNVIGEAATDSNGRQDRETILSGVGPFPKQQLYGDIYWMENKNDEADVGGWLIPESSFIAKQAELVLNHAPHMFVHQLENGRFAK